MSLEAALMTNDKEIIKKICADMSKTERNFILKKGEATLSFRTEKLEKEYDRSLLGLFEKILERKDRAAENGAPKSRESSTTF
jgi:hypothetical protein